MMAALYAAFWLQLESASSAAVCVGILALQTRGQAYEKALYRLAGTIIGVIASIAIVGLFNEVRDLFVLAFAAWMGLCVYAASLLDGNRAYAAVLSGYTVAIVAVANVDTPQAVFDSGINRGAAIIIGIVAVMFFNDLFAAPDTFPGLLGRLEAAHRRVMDFARKVLREGQADPQSVAELIRTIVAFRVDISALPTESIAGRARAAAGRTVVAAMAREVSAARAGGVVLHSLEGKADDLVDALSRLLDQPFGAHAEALQKRIDRLLDTHQAANPLFVAASCAHVLIEQNRRTLTAFDDLRQARGASRGPRLPPFRSRAAALRNALRVFLAMLIGALFCIVTGWPSTSTTLVLLGATAGLSATAPSPQQVARAALIAMPSAFALAGIIEFLILDGVDAFPLLALGMAPVIIGAGLLVGTGNPKLAPIGSLLLVFTPVLLSPSNPQNYDPQSYLISGSLAVVAVIILFIVLATVLPTSEERKRGWILRSLRADFRRALSESRPRHTPDEVAFRDGDRVGQLGALQTTPSEDHVADLRCGLRWAALTSAAWRVRIALSDPRLPRDVERVGRAALAAKNPNALRASADHLVAKRSALAHDALGPCRWAATTLAWMATLIEHSPREIAELEGRPQR